MTATERAEWLKLRQSGIGSSDAPNLVGVGYKTAADVYRSKTEPLGPEREPAGFLKRGILLEPLVAAEYAGVMGCELRPAAFARNPLAPWQIASPDYVRIDDSDRRVEMKTTAGFGSDWGESGTDEIPDGYRVQVQHQMGVLGETSIDLAALDAIAWELRVYRLAFDAELFAWLSEVQAEAWERIQARRPIGPEWEGRFAPEAERRLITKGKAVELGDEAAAMLRMRKELGAIRDEADAEHKRLSEQLHLLMGEAEVATCDGWRLKRTLVAGATVSYERQPYTRLDIRAARKGASE